MKNELSDVLVKEAYMKLVESNISSFVKENIISNRLIRSDMSDDYYNIIIKILGSDLNGFVKEIKLDSFLKKYR